MTAARRAGLLLAGVLALDATGAFAQASPARVTITGLADNVTSYTRNLSLVDLNHARQSDGEWYVRSRIRTDVAADVSTTTFVLALELDHAWGQTGAADTVASGGAVQRFGTAAGVDLNSDLVGHVEVKWAYTEFDAPALPWPVRVRLGAQPWAVAYKIALATGDFAGAFVGVRLSPQVKLDVTWAQIEEESTGPRDGFIRGEDFAIVATAEITPFRGFDLRPTYAVVHADGVTSFHARLGRGGVSNTAGFFPAGAEEVRHTVGLDAKWRLGPAWLEPTAFYQWGTREIASGGRRTGEQRKRAWFFDVRGSAHAGRWLTELAAIYTTGNDAREDLAAPGTTTRFFEAISTDTGYYEPYAQHWALGIDYFTITHGTAGGLNTGTAIGYDKYGLARLGGRVSHAVSPAVTLWSAVTANWTAEEVDTSGSKASATGLRPGDFRGNARYLGTEVDLGLEWRLAPALAFNIAAGYTFSGPALRARLATNSGTGVVRAHGDPQDMQSVAARVRYTF